MQEEGLQSLASALKVCLTENRHERKSHRGGGNIAEKVWFVFGASPWAGVIIEDRGELAMARRCEDRREESKRNVVFLYFAPGALRSRGRIIELHKLRGLVGRSETGEHLGESGRFHVIRASAHAGDVMSLRTAAKDYSSRLLVAGTAETAMSRFSVSKNRSVPRAILRVFLRSFAPSRALPSSSDLR
jgi:hypothetical protein